MTQQPSKPPAIVITTRTTYLDQQSEPEAQQFAFAYTISIENNGEHSVQLLSRHWLISDANDQQQEVQGIGVVGEQPHILPGACYTYSSGAVLPTQTGTMEGRYHMQSACGATFEVPIPAFSLARPQSLH